MDARKAHRQSCSKCKEAIYQILVEAFGSCNIRQQYRLGILSTLQGYKEHPNFSTLEMIESDLKTYRGFRQFVSRRSLPPVDYFVTSVGLIVEFDEAQHFTRPRALTLERYPASLQVGFSRQYWLQQCAKLNRHDNSPPYRD